MDLSSMWLPELEMEDGAFMNQYDMMNKPYDIIDNLNTNSILPEFYTEKECFIDRSFQAPTRFEKQTEITLPGYQKASNINTRTQTPKTFSATSSSSNTFTISFGDLNPKDDISPFDNSALYEDGGNGKVSTMARTQVQAKDHVLAERKRRENLNRQFISMSALLPNLKKMDKASVLEDATHYIRELQDRVKELEGLASFERTDAKSYIIALKRSQLNIDDDNDSSSPKTNSEDCIVDVHCKSSAEIEVRISGSSVLVRIHSQKNSSMLERVLSKMQKLGLSIMSSAAMPFANSNTLITIGAQIEDGFYLTATDIVRSLQQSL